MVLLFPTFKFISSDKCNKYKIEYKLTFKLCKIWLFLFPMHKKKLEITHIAGNPHVVNQRADSENLSVFQPPSFKQ